MRKNSFFQEVFFAALAAYSPRAGLADELWTDICTAYADCRRHYHNLHHLEQLATGLFQVKSFIGNWNAIVFAIAYHDFVYQASRHNNEEESMQRAVTRLSAFVDAPTMEQCKVLILATKKHEAASDGDVNYFTDGDLSILGAEPREYDNYASNIRKEYSLYPDLIYKPGRKKVIRHFLDMKRIFKTDWFCNRYEEAARRNLENELKLL